MTIKDIAKEAGYSVGTVSRVLNDSRNVSEKARKRILEVVEKNGFKLNSYAKSLKQKSNGEILIIVKGSLDLQLADMLKAMQRCALENGFPADIKYIEETENEVLIAKGCCEACRPAGIIFLGSCPENFKKDFEDTDIPCVLADASAKDFGFCSLSCVFTDEKLAAECAAKFLLGLGHKKIALISTPSKATQYKAGFKKAFEENGAFFDEELGCEEAPSALEGGYEAMNRLLNKYPSLTAVFAASDMAAAGAVRALKDKGLSVPEDVSVLGFGGGELASYTVPRISVLRRSTGLIAKRSVQILADMINKKDMEAEHEAVPFEIVQAESTAGSEKE